MATWHRQVDPLQPQIDTQRSGEASQYTPDPLVASFQEQELKLPPSLDLNWAQRVKTGNPTTLRPVIWIPISITISCEAMMWNLDGTLKRLSIFPHPREVVAASADMATGVGEGREEGKPGADNRRAGMS